VQIRPGSLLIAHPAHAHAQDREQVVYITESNSYSTVGLALNTASDYDLRDLLLEQGIDFSEANTLYTGGDYNRSALVMLHTDEWYSSNTMQIHNNFSISSDHLMMEKLEMGNTPEWYRIFIGWTAWDSQDIEHQLKCNKPKWLLLANPSHVLIELADDELWNNAIAEYSQDVFSNYI